jgi:threonine aldolase
VIDLRTDTVTQPTAGMRRAVAEAVVGDEQKREDPTVTALEERAAALLGHEEAIYLPTATMANQIALRLLTEPGDEVVAEARAHIFRYELGGPAVHSGLVMKPLPTGDGRFTAAQLRDAVNPPADLHMAPTRVVCLENTHNAGGGRVWPLARVREVAEEARRHGLAVHLDGARLLNAVVASGTAASEYGREADTVTLCLSKGLGCPLGALLAGSRERMARARRLKHLFGGAMRQAGIVAAAGLYALEHHVERLADDHARARRLADGLAELPGVDLDPATVDTNIVIFAVPDAAAFCSALAGEDVAMSQFGPRRVRAVTHLDVDDEGIDRALAAAARALG